MNYFFSLIAIILLTNCSMINGSLYEDFNRDGIDKPLFKFGNVGNKKLYNGFIDTVCIGIDKNSNQISISKIIDHKPIYKPMNDKELHNLLSELSRDSITFEKSNSYLKCQEFIKTQDNLIFYLKNNYMINKVN